MSRTRLIFFFFHMSHWCEFYLFVVFSGTLYFSFSMSFVRRQWLWVETKSLIFVQDKFNLGYIWPVFLHQSLTGINMCTWVNVLGMHTCNVTYLNIYMKRSKCIYMMVYNRQKKLCPECYQTFPISTFIHFDNGLVVVIALGNHITT